MGQSVSQQPLSNSVFKCQIGITCVSKQFQTNIFTVFSLSLSQSTCRQQTINMNKFGLALCCTIVIISLCGSEASPLIRRNEDQKCKDLCNLCSCVGFYCGDECICECNNKDDESEFFVSRPEFDKWFLIFRLFFSFCSFFF